MQDAHIISMFMNNNGTQTQIEKFTVVCNIQTYNIKKGILKFGSKGKNTVNNKLSQLHNRDIFKLVMTSQLSTKEKKKDINGLIFLTEKRDGTKQAKTCANKSTQQACINKQEAASPNVTTEALIATAVNDVKQGRKMINLDIPNAFVQTPMPKSKLKVIMRFNGILMKCLP